jgi:hypothetical protein
MNQLVLVPSGPYRYLSARMASLSARTDRFAPGSGRPAGAATRMPQARSNTVTASQARAAQRREARRDELAVAAWLRELSGRGR